jgi:hypothetical protein
MKNRPTRHQKKFETLLRERLPESPGIYRFWDEQDRLIYVGKARNLRRRLSQYRNAKRIKRHWKMRMLVEEAHRFEWEVLDSDQHALTRELEVIQRERPKFNVSGAFARFYPFIAWKSVGALSVAHWSDQPESLAEGFEVHGAYRSRGVTREAFEAWARLLKWVYRSAPLSRAIRLGLTPSGPSRWKRESLVPLVGMKEQEWKEWGDFFSGRSTRALEELIYLLMESPRARDRRKQVQKDINLLKHFWLHEAAKLRKLRERAGYAAYPVLQVDRDHLTLTARFTQAEPNASSG